MQVNKGGMAGWLYKMMKTGEKSMPGARHWKVQGKEGRLFTHLENLKYRRTQMAERWRGGAGGRGWEAVPVSGGKRKGRKR